MTKENDLFERVLQFKLLELPGQPQSMHMGTSYLVDDLEKEIKRLRAEIKRLRAEVEHLRVYCRFR